MRFNLRNVCHWIRPIVSGEYWGQRPAAVAHSFSARQCVALALPGR
jgi:hypothetical protein